ncbi:MAG: nucleotidyltransferase domain-containing protein [Candidatus Kapaibacterium sp.]
MYSYNIPDDVRSEILERLQQIEDEENVAIFLAVESGSRAWGFPSKDSDYDVRFLYVHPPEWYLSIDMELRRDVIERPINDSLDISGWDLRKGLQLLRKSNPPLLEWLVSPIIYREKKEITEKMRELLPTYYSPRASADLLLSASFCRPTTLRELLPTYYSPRASLYHYLSMAKGNYREYLQGETVRTKKYFYVLRPLLAIKWIEADIGPVPMQFQHLVDRLLPNGPLRAEIDLLLTRKMSGEELDKEPRIPLLNNFIEEELSRMESVHVDHVSPKPEIESLNEFFRWVIGMSS